MQNILVLLAFSCIHFGVALKCQQGIEGTIPNVTVLTPSSELTCTANMTYCVRYNITGGTPFPGATFTARGCANMDINFQANVTGVTSNFTVEAKDIQCSAKGCHSTSTTQYAGQLCCCEGDLCNTCKDDTCSCPGDTCPGASGTPSLTTTATVAGTTTTTASSTTVTLVLLTVFAKTLF